MTDERAGQLNEPNLMGELTFSVHMGLGGNGWACSNYGGDEMVYMEEQLRGAAEEVVYALLKRGLINELGIEILKRDGVIPPSPQFHDKPPSEPS